MRLGVELTLELCHLILMKRLCSCDTDNHAQPRNDDNSARPFSVTIVTLCWVVDLWRLTPFLEAELLGQDRTIVAYPLQ